MCYRFEKYIFDKGIFDNSVDVTYIIHLENNGRLPNIMNQIEKCKPTKQVFILFNKGYKNCNKSPDITSPLLDLVDSYLTIFKHASSNKYKNILIFEDDFEINKNIDNNDVISINNFINNRNGKFIYYLGCIPFIIAPYDFNHYVNIISVGSHAFNIFLQNYVIIYYKQKLLILVGICFAVRLQNIVIINQYIINYFVQHK